MDGETEDFCAYGDALMYGGAHLHPAFGGTGYDENVRYFPDFASLLYLMDCNLYPKSAMIQKSNSGRTGDKKIQKRNNRLNIAVAAVVI